MRFLGWLGRGEPIRNSETTTSSPSIRLSTNVIIYLDIRFSDIPMTMQIITFEVFKVFQTAPRPPSRLQPPPPWFWGIDEAAVMRSLAELVPLCVILLSPVCLAYGVD